jgi:hypothetical protein
MEVLNEKYFDARDVLASNFAQSYEVHLGTKFGDDITIAITSSSHH